MISEAEARAKASLPNAPIWRGMTFRGSLISDSTVCVDRTWGPKGGPGGTRGSAGHVLVKFPEGSLGEPTDGTCASANATASPSVRSPAPVMSARLACVGDDAAPFSTAAVMVRVIGPDVVAKWTWTGDPPASGTFGLFLTMKGRDTHQLGYKAQDGRQVAIFDFDTASSRQTNLPGTAVLTSSGSDITFPDAAAPYLQGFTATATVSVDGTDVMTCKG